MEQRDVLRDLTERTGSLGPPAAAAASGAAQPHDDVRPTSERGRLGLSAKLLMLTGAFVMLAEVLIFVPSIANFRVTWLSDRLTAAHLAALAAEAVPGGVVPAPLRNELLATAQVRAVAIKRNGQRRLVLPADGELNFDETFDLRSISGSGMMDQTTARLGLIVDALETIALGHARMIRVLGPPPPRPGMPANAADFIEIVLPEAPLKAAMARFSFNILVLSLVISGITAAFVYLALNGLLVQPMRRLARNMLRFSQNPEDPTRAITPSTRGDEIGTAERELAHMQRELTQMLHQRSRLAQLGLAVSKVNHDLRNMLASAQLISDRLTALPDPTVQRFAPKLIASLDRAISFCNDTLRFGRAEEAAPRREQLALRAIVEDIGDGLNLPRDGLAWRLEIGPDLVVDADREHIFRILNNLCRNAVQAIESSELGGAEIAVAARREASTVTIDVRDTGPGVPEKARAHLFQAFQGSTRRGGTGLGLVIASELAQAHGGSLRLVPSDRGAVFRLEIPDRPASLAA